MAGNFKLKMHDNHFAVEFRSDPLKELTSLSSILQLH